MRNKTLVFGDDSSVSADLAWLWINSHPWPGWRMEVLTAAMPADLVARTVAPEAHAWSPTHPRRAFVESRLDEVDHLRIDADPRLALCRPADLLVLGSRGPGVAKALHIGSTVEWLLTHPPAPMLVVRHGRSTRAAVVCHDGSIHAQAATDALCNLPWVSELAVTVLIVEDGRTDVDRTLAAATESLESADVDVRHHIVRNGDPVADAQDFLGRHDADLVVLGTRGLTGMRRLRLGSTAGSITRSTPHSVLLVCADIQTDGESTNAEAADLADAAVRDTI